MVWSDLCQVSKVSEKDLQDQQREYSPQTHSEPASTISGSTTTFLTISYARHPIYTSYTSWCPPESSITLGNLVCKIPLQNKHRHEPHKVEVLGLIFLVYLIPRQRWLQLSRAILTTRLRRGIHISFVPSRLINAARSCCMYSDITDGVTELPSSDKLR